MKTFLLQSYVLCGFLFRFFVGNLYGIFMLMIFLYYSSPFIINVQPLNGYELILWIDVQSSSTKGLLLSSMLTIVGFTIAFAAATSSWRRQLQANLRVEAAQEVDLTYARITELISSIKIYAETLLRVNNDIKENKSELDIFSGIQFVLSQTQKFLNERQELSVLHIRSYQLAGHHANVFLASGKTFNIIQLINQSVAVVADKMWILYPVVDINSPDYVQIFLRCIDEERLKALSTECEKSHQYVSGMAGFVKGQVTAPLTELNFSYFYNFICKGKTFIDILRKVQSKEIISDEQIAKLSPKEVSAPEKSDSGK